LSLRQLKRILKRYNLRRRLNNDENIADVTEVIQSELLSDGCNLGYRSMHQKLIIKYHLNTSREQVRQILGPLNPEGVDSRKKEGFDVGHMFVRAQMNYGTWTDMISL
uniref:Uncharacterized protein n=1 Tax=Clytia hemisphaerica TaxID=252671 RepID=A0A7M5XGW9_9CNID